MASPRGGSSRDVDAALDSESDSSYVGTDDSQPHGTDSCRWRTAAYHDQECSRYFDCPSHQVERRLSIDESSDDPAISRDLLNLDLAAERRENSTEQAAEELENPARGEALATPLTDPAGAVSTSQGASSSAIHTTPPPSEPEEQLLGHSASAQRARTPARTPGEDIDDLQQPLADSPRWESQTERNEPRHATSAPPDHPRNEGLDSEAQRRDDSLPPTPREEPLHHSPTSYGQESRRASEFTLPRWQPDAEVTYCPICHSQFNIFVRKHHCRKCGRVVCNACSPHRIIIPHQYIVRPPGSEIPLPQSLLVDGLGGGYFDGNSLSGGERVRLCNPCVPDPNTAPPHSPAATQAPSPRSSHHRSRSSMSSTYAPAGNPSRHSTVIPSSSGYESYRYYSPRSRSITMAGGPSSRQGRSETYQATFDRIMTGGTLNSASISYPMRVSSLGSDASSSRQRVLPPTPQIAEDDECPICHRELPSRSLPDFETVREAHINMCIQTHSTYGSPRAEGGENAPLAAPRRTGMYAYSATEKDCIDDAECTICLEEFTPKVRMARLECLCRFHYACISAWFVNHPGRCPVHQHDGFGY